MKIIFVISSINSRSNGLGGHFHSLIETIKQVSINYDCEIINIGTYPALTLTNSNIKTYDIISQRPNLIRNYQKFYSIVKKSNPDILHAFDDLSFYYVRITSSILNIDTLLTKCGGVNPKYYPAASNLVVYSLENLKYFKKLAKYSNSNISLIPNRISHFNDDLQLIDKILLQLGDYRTSFKFLRISRIGKYYKKSFLQIINLIKKLNELNIDCCAIFIGVIEDQQTFEELKSISPINIFFFNDKEYSANAKKVLNLSDAVVGTGRSFMEAASKGKILMSPINNSNFPLLINRNNFMEAFEFNFSERTEIKYYSEIDNFESIIDIIKNPKMQAEYSEYASHVFDEYFNSTVLSEKYSKVYTRLIPQKTAGVDFMLHTLFYLRSYFR